jgi:putative FmdB family regulatory protein
MPTYDYACLKCGHSFELVRPISAAALEVCPEDVCPKSRWGRGKLKRGIGGGAGLLFRGSGFYQTDYRSAGYKAAAKAEIPAAPTTPTAAKGGTPAKSDATGSAGKEK